MAELTVAKLQEHAEMWGLLAQLTREQSRSMLHLCHLMYLRQLGDQTVEAEIQAITEACEDGRILPVPSMH